MRSLRSGATTLFILFTVSLAFSQSSTPRAVVESFYRFDMTHGRIFDGKNIDARKHWFTDVLYLQFQNELKRQREHLRRNPTEKPHFGDGLPFRPLDETCKVGRRTYRLSHAVGTASMRGSNATVPVTFSYPKRCSLPSTEYVVRLRRVKGAWQINDLEYPDGSTLLADLTRAEY